MRRQRRILVKAVGAGTIKTYEPILDGESRDFVQNLAKPGMDFRETLLGFVYFLHSLVIRTGNSRAEVSCIAGITLA